MSIGLKLTKWSKDIKTGILWQDCQHKELLDNMYALNQSIHEKKGVEQVSETTAFLDNYINNHFGIEGKYMEVYQYPGMEQHLKEHADFIAKLGRIKETFNSKFAQLISAIKLCVDLNEWFVNHIKTYDKELGEFLKPKF